MKAIVVTGGTGFIGRAVAGALREELGEDSGILALGSSQVDLVDRDATLAWFRDTAAAHEITDVYHLAALYKAGGWPIDHPATQLQVNMAINMNVLEALARHARGAKLTSVLSYCMYPPHDDAHPESELWGSEPEEYLYAYALTKKALLVGHKAYQQEYGLRSTSVVLPTVYGPGDSFREDSHVMGALVGKFVRATRDGAAEVEVWGDGSQEREFLFIEDAVDGILAASRRSEAPVHNLGVGRPETVRRIAEVIQDAAGFPGTIRFNRDRFVGVQRRHLDVSLAQKDLGWTAATSLEDGIEKTVRWYEAELSGHG